MKLRRITLYCAATLGLSSCGDLPESKESMLNEVPISSVPSADAECRDISSRLVAPRNAAGVMFDENCTTAFVLPPVKGEAKISQISRISHLNFCPAVLDAGDVAEDTMASAASIASNVRRMIAGYDILDQGIHDLRKEVAIFKANRDLAKATQKEAEDESQMLREIYVEAGEALQLCSLGGGDCQSQEDSAAAARQEFTGHFQNSLLAARQAARRSEADYERASGRLLAETNRYATGTEPLLNLQKQLFELNSQVMDLYREWASLEGLTGQIVYGVPWDTLVSEFKTLNNQLDINFTPIRVIDGSFYAATKLAVGDFTGIPALISSVVPGASPKGIKHFPQGGSIDPEGVDVSHVSAGFSTLTGSGANSVSGQIILSVAGSCPYFPDGDQSAPRESISYQELTAHLVANTELVYEVKARRKYDAEYHMGMWMSRVERQTRRGGFFSSSALHSIVEDGNSNDWFKITFDENSSEFGYSSEEQLAITKEVKADLIDRSMRQIAMQTGFASSPPPVPGLQPTGVGIAASRVNSGCWWWSYCRSAGFVLGVLDSIFGRREAVSEFKRRNNSWTRESVNQVKVLRRSALISFSAEESDRIEDR